MENLRWILIFAGVAILVALWLAGRSGRRDVGASRTSDPLLDHDPLGDGFGDFDDVDPDDFARPAAPGAGVPGRRAGTPPLAPVTAFDDAGSARDAFGAELRDRPDAVRETPSRAPAAAAPAAPNGLSALTAKFEAIGEKLAPNRRRPIESGFDDESPEPAAPPRASKIVMLHVVAPNGGILPPEALRDMLERRGYHHGDMDIYHSLFQGRTVFSVARMIKPGTFDLDDLSTYETPGIALILQLPGPIEADRAFEAMLAEAFEMAGELGATVLDGDRSTLGRQTEQHLRESIHEYMHRQKYFDSVA